jgi:hypothetical protein
MFIMLRFFSKIRFQLAAENNIGKYLRYAIGEILLVVIGILIALQINNWNENKKLDAAKQAYYLQLLKDLNTDKDYISGKIEMFSDRIARYDTYLSSFNKPNLLTDEVMQNLNKLDYTVDHIRFQNNTIVSLESTGDLKLLPVDLRNRLLDLKRRQELILEFTKSNYDYYMDIIRPSGLAIGVWDLPSRLQNQPEFAKLLDIDNKMDIAFMSFDYAQFIKNYSESNLLRDLENMQTDIEKIIEIINSNIDN